MAIQMTCLGVHLISAIPLSRSISANSKYVLLPNTRSAPYQSTFCFIFSETEEFYDLQVGENVRFARLVSSRSSDTTSLERRKWNQNNRTGAARAPAEDHVGRQPFVNDTARVTVKRLSFSSV